MPPRPPPRAPSLQVYHPATTQLNIIGLQIVSVETAISDLNAFVISLVPELGADTTFDVYEEVCHSMLTELNSSLTVSDADLGDGDVLVFQAKRRGPQNATRTRTRNGFGAIKYAPLPGTGGGGGRHGISGCRSIAIPRGGGVGGGVQPRGGGGTCISNYQRAQ